MERYTIEGTVNLEKMAIERLKCFEDFALQMHPNGYYVAYSGGKDSDCIRILCELAGVKHELWHNHTTVDAPETVYYVRSIVPEKQISKPDMSMWGLIVKKGIPPLQQIRYCCEILKEHGGEGRFVVTGVRRAESIKRSDGRVFQIRNVPKKDRIIFSDDNDENRRMLEPCQLKGKRTLNPIVDWTDDDVWEFLNYYGCKSNPLYKCGFKRVGCIGCPMASFKHRRFQFERYPKYKELYIRAFDKMLKVEGREHKDWKSGEEVFDWWTSEKVDDLDIDGQISLWEDAE